MAALEASVAAAKAARPRHPAKKPEDPEERLNAASAGPPERVRPDAVDIAGRPVR